MGSLSELNNGAAWKIVFLLTAAIGVTFLCFMPDNQLNARLLTKERITAVWRIRINQQGSGNKHFKMHQLKECLTDPLTWAFCFYALVADIPNGENSFFIKADKKEYITDTEQAALPTSSPS
jgi:MFS transporter, ACS family, allantoate permease